MFIRAKDIPYLRSFIAWRAGHGNGADIVTNGMIFLLRFGARVELAAVQSADDLITIKDNQRIGVKAFKAHTRFA